MCMVQNQNRMLIPDKTVTASKFKHMITVVVTNLQWNLFHYFHAIFHSFYYLNSSRRVIEANRHFSPWNCKGRSILFLKFARSQFCPLSWKIPINLVLFLFCCIILKVLCLSWCIKRLFNSMCMFFICFNWCLLKKYFDGGTKLIAISKFEGLNWPTVTIWKTKISIYSSKYRSEFHHVPY